SGNDPAGQRDRRVIGRPYAALESPPPASRAVGQGRSRPGVDHLPHGPRATDADDLRIHRRSLLHAARCEPRLGRSGASAIERLDAPPGRGPRRHRNGTLTRGPRQIPRDRVVLERVVQTRGSVDGEVLDSEALPEVAAVAITRRLRGTG